MPDETAVQADAPDDLSPDVAAPTIPLQQLLKLAGLVASGGEAKVRIQAGEVRVNGEVETRRRKQLISGDTVSIDELEIVVDLEPDEEE
jgi:ribosome-associated protein